MFFRPDSPNRRVQRAREDRDVVPVVWLRLGRYVQMRGFMRARNTFGPAVKAFEAPFLSPSFINGFQLCWFHSSGFLRIPVLPSTAPTWLRTAPPRSERLLRQRIVRSVSSHKAVQRVFLRRSGGSSLAAAPPHVDRVRVSPLSRKREHPRPLPPPAVASVQLRNPRSTASTSRRASGFRGHARRTRLARASAHVPAAVPR